MKLTLSTYGGFAAGIAQRDRTLDTEDLPAEAAVRVLDLVSQTSAQPRGRSTAKDGRTYEIQIAETENGRSATIEQSDGTLTPEFVELLRLIRSHTK